MKNIFKKNQVIITALAIMIAVAGYLNFTRDTEEEQEPDSNIADSALGFDLFPEDSTGENPDLFTDISDEDSSKDPLQVSDSGEVNVGSKNIAKDGDDKSKEGKDKSEVGDGSNPGEAVLASTSINSSFFSSAKLAREQTRAKNKETLMGIVESGSVTEEQKQAALDDVLKLTETAELENSTELLLEAKGFDGVVVSIVDGSVDVVVNTENIDSQQVAQIEDIVIRKTGFEADSIVISPVVVQD